MERKAFIFAAFLVAFANITYAADLVPVEITKLFTPKHQDDSEQAVVVLEGFLPNSCYSLARPVVKVDEQTRQIMVTQYARRSSTPICTQMLVPYYSEVQVGVLPQGVFTIVASTGDTGSVLDIAEAPSGGPENVAYAPVDSVNIQYRQQDFRRTIILFGRLTSTCMVWDRVEVGVVDDVVEVRPLVTIVEDSDCVAVENNYRKEVMLPVDLAEGRYLLHVKSMNGHSLNLLFNQVKNKRSSK